MRSRVADAGRVGAVYCASEGTGDLEDAVGEVAPRWSMAEAALFLTQMKRGLWAGGAKWVLRSRLCEDI